MADKNKQNEIFDSADLYKEYFSEDEEALNDLLDKLRNLQAIEDGQIRTMVEAAPGRGVQHNLIEHMTNAISIAAQFQSVLKDKRTIKERSLDLAIKSNKEETESSDMESVIASMQKMIKETKNRQINNVDNLQTKIERTNEDLDAEIEKKLGIN